MPPQMPMSDPFAGHPAELPSADPGRASRARVQLHFLPGIPSTGSAAGEVLQRTIDSLSGFANKYFYRIQAAESCGPSVFASDPRAGRPLSEILDKTSRLDIPRAVALTARLLKGLQAAHEQGLVHGCLNPDLIDVVERRNGESLRIHGLAIYAAWARELGDEGLFSAAALPCRAPERLEGFGADIPSDVYAAGAILYRCLSGQWPFFGKTRERLLEDMRSRAPVAPECWRPEIRRHAGLSEVVLKAVAIDPAFRYQSAGEFLQDLLAVRRGTFPEALREPPGAAGRSVKRRPMHGPPPGRSRRHRRRRLARESWLKRQLSAALLLTAVSLGGLAILWAGFKVIRLAVRNEASGPFEVHDLTPPQKP
jgi:hypothetical protein